MWWDAWWDNVADGVSNLQLRVSDFFWSWGSEVVWEFISEKKTTNYERKFAPKSCQSWVKSTCRIIGSGLGMWMVAHRIAKMMEHGTWWLHLHLYTMDNINFDHFSSHWMTYILPLQPAFHFGPSQVIIQGTMSQIHFYACPKVRYCCK